MKSRQRIEDGTLKSAQRVGSQEAVLGVLMTSQLEVLLDIRDLLTKLVPSTT